MPPDRMQWENTAALCDIPAKDAQPESNHEKTSRKSKLRDIRQNNWSVIL